MMKKCSSKVCKIIAIIPHPPKWIKLIFIVNLCAGWREKQLWSSVLTMSFVTSLTPLCLAECNLQCDSKLFIIKKGKVQHKKFVRTKGKWKKNEREICENVFVNADMNPWIWVCSKKTQNFLLSWNLIKRLPRAKTFMRFNEKCARKCEKRFGVGNAEWKLRFEFVKTVKCFGLYSLVWSFSFRQTSVKRNHHHINSMQNQYEL